MLDLAITNIGNIGKEIFLFYRINKELKTMRDVTFFPYYYQIDEKGLFITIDGKKVKRIICSRPSDVARKRDNESYEADIIYTKRYAIDKIGTFLKCELKYSFIDIEVQCPELPQANNPKYPISCISCSNSYTDEIKTFFIKDYKPTNVKVNFNFETANIENQEKQLLDDFIKWIKEQQFDFIAAWNMINFDYSYLCARYKFIMEMDLSNILSPIAQSKPLGETLFIPQGLGIVDYLEWYKRVCKGETSYALDSIAQKHLNKPPKKKMDFNKLSDEIKEKNINDVKDMIELEKKFKLIEYFDELRRIGKCNWEDLSWNSKILDNMLLQEAKQKGIILPTKKYASECEDDITFEGAYRRCDIEDEKGNVLKRHTGLHKNLWKVDIGGAYPSAIVNFCLDIQNLRGIESKYYNKGIKVNEVSFIQNQNALLPTLARKLIYKKDELKRQLKLLNPESKEAKDLQIKYDAIKSVVNSLFGICGLKIFRLFNIKVASSITYLIRDLLHYVENKLIEQEMQVIYLDTDSIFIQSKENPKDLCNQLVKQWAKKKYGKDFIDISFDLEGQYEKIFIVSLCHYKGYLRTKSGLKEEIKGIEARRADSSKFMKEFQTNLLEKVMNEELRESIEKWIESEKIRIKILPLTTIGFPCKKIKEESAYKSVPIFIRALNYTQEINPNFKKLAGDSFYYINVLPFGETTRKSSRMKKNKETGTKELQNSETNIEKNVLAFDEENNSHIKNIDWNKVIDKNINNKVEKIFIAMGWIEKQSITIKEKYSVPDKKMLQKAKDLGYKHLTHDGKIIEIDVEKDSISEIDKQITELIAKKKKLQNSQCGNSVMVAQQVSNLQDRVRVPVSAPNTINKFNEIQKIKEQTTVKEEFHKEDVKMKEIDFKTAKEIIKANHYSHTMPVTNLFLAFYYKGKLNCVIVYGSGASSRLKDSLPNPNFLELVRLFSFDIAPKNMESYCIGQSINYIKQHKPEIKILVSFADPSQGHIGYIYQATNWLYTGLSDKAGNTLFKIDGIKYHPRTFAKKYGVTSGEKLEELIKKDNPNSKVERYEYARKHRYLMFIGNKRENKEMRKNLKYQVLSYPKIIQNNEIEKNISQKEVIKVEMLKAENNLIIGKSQ